MSEATSNNPNRIALRILFPTLINEAWYPRFKEEKDKLIDRVQQIREEDVAGREHSATQFVNGYTSFFCRSDLHNDPVFENIVRFIYEVAQDYAYKQYWDLENFDLVITQFWSNINSKYCYHRDHVHPFSQISGVVYLQVEEDGAPISFKDPRVARWVVPAPVSENRPENTTMAAISPAEGKLLMFPSWMDHGVSMNLSDQDRISMSYNLDLRPKKQR